MLLLLLQQPCHCNTVLAAGQIRGVAHSQSAVEALRVLAVAGLGGGQRVVLDGCMLVVEPAQHPGMANRRIELADTGDTAVDIGFADEAWGNDPFDAQDWCIAEEVDIASEHSIEAEEVGDFVGVAADTAVAPAASVAHKDARPG